MENDHATIFKILPANERKAVAVQAGNQGGCRAKPERYQYVCYSQEYGTDPGCPLPPLASKDAIWQTDACRCFGDVTGLAGICSPVLASFDFGHTSCTLVYYNID